MPFPPTVAPPQDTTWPGTIKLSVNVTDLARHVMQVHETIPVQPNAVQGGKLVLLYPKWIPGDHGPTGPLRDIAGLTIQAGGKTVPWVRDVVNMYAFHVDVPQGATSLDVSFQYLSPTSTSQGRIEMTPEMVDLAWNTVVLYPAGRFSRGITVAPSLTLPQGWKFGTALETSTVAGNHVDFKPVTLNTLVDSPVFAGRYFKRADLAPGAAVPVHLDVVADRPGDLAITPDELARHRALVHQATTLFGSQHYNHYDFLLALSDQLGGTGLEHHRSSENATDRDYFTGWDKSFAVRDLLSHEYTHSWNGKFRRPADLWAPNFNVPERDSLLWVYEGQTQYWGQVLAARSGLWSRAQARGAIADDAASMQLEVGRAWRPLQDTTNDPIINERRPQPWHSWEREEDYYTEGLLIWLDADTLIRERTHGQKSLNDFARGFFGIDDGSFVTVTYRFDDIVHALNAVMPFDWAHFLRSRLDRIGGKAPLDGITRGGYRLVYTDKPSAFLKSEEAAYKRHIFDWSIGLSLGKDGAISDVLWDGPAWHAGLAKGGKIVAVDGLAFSGADDLSDAIKQAANDKAPISLLVQEGKQFRTVQIGYHGGLRYPHLERIPGKTALLDDILAPLP
ncbi:M61 family metallopeptidase [Lichenicoccus sp.]|uniref:M61 family metallopeptidase n=1 Tax=Lichenicoccus sp. TaxID=2781899 RepID=UPI003D0D2760